MGRVKILQQFSDSRVKTLYRSKYYLTGNWFQVLPSGSTFCTYREQDTNYGGVNWNQQKSIWKPGMKLAQKMREMLLKGK